MVSPIRFTPLLLPFLGSVGAMDRVDLPGAPCRRLVRRSHRVTTPTINRAKVSGSMFIHVPCAWMSLFTYAVMAGAAAVGLIWRMKLADVVVASAAPVGAVFTFLALVTGAIWGKPMWGTWWVWDARLTSELVLLFPLSRDHRPAGSDRRQTSRGESLRHSCHHRCRQPAHHSLFGRMVEHIAPGADRVQARHPHQHVDPPC